jgi:hypothetical protein
MPLAWMAWLPMVLCFAFALAAAAILLDGLEGPPAIASLALALGFGVLAAWLHLSRLRQVPVPAEPPQSMGRSSAPLPAPAPPRVERRRHPRVAVDWPVEIRWHHAERLPSRLCNLSIGGACLLLHAPEPVGRRGLLLIPGLSLPAPFTVVASLPETGLHIRFDLEGMGLDALEQQIDALVARPQDPR